jgi:hypothetical protein
MCVLNDGLREFTPRVIFFVMIVYVFIEKKNKKIILEWKREIEQENGWQQPRAVGVHTWPKCVPWAATASGKMRKSTASLVLRKTSCRLARTGQSSAIV